MARQSRHHAGRQHRPEAAEPSPPGMAARVAAARAIAEALTQSRSLDERFAPDLSTRGGLDERDRALARSIATVALRRLGTIRKALAQRLDKGMPKRGGMLEWTLIVAAAQILFLNAPDHAAVDLAVQAARADPASAPFAALANAVLRTIARERDAILASSDPSTTIRLRGSPRAGAPLMARRRRAPSPPRTVQSRRSTSASKATPPAGLNGSAGSSCRPARFASTPINPSPNSKATPRANGGCRTPRPRCRLGYSACVRACGSPISAPPRAARPQSLRPPAPT